MTEEGTEIDILIGKANVVPCKQLAV